MLPRVKIEFANGALGQMAASSDGVFGLLANAAPVAEKLRLLKTYIVRSLDDAKGRLGITQENNPGLHKLLAEFYAEAGDGTELWIKCFAETVKMTEMVDLATEDGVKSLLTEANGRIKGLFVHYSSRMGQTITIENGLNSDVYTAIAKAQLTAAYATDTLKAPLFVVVAGLNYTGEATELTPLNTMQMNRVGVMIGDTRDEKGCALGLLAGRLARIPVQRNVGRVRDGAIATNGFAYIGSEPVETADIETIHDKGYITLRMHTGRAGYFFSDDPLATLPTDDYNHITARRTVDKAYRIAYDVLLGELLEEIPVSDQGQVSVTFAKSVETKVENAIINSMTSNSELGNDPANQNDTGIECLIDTNQNIVSTGFLKVGLRVKPYGYARYINVELGFKTISQ